METSELIKVAYRLRKGNKTRARFIRALEELKDASRALEALVEIQETRRTALVREIRKG